MQSLSPRCPASLSPGDYVAAGDVSWSEAFDRMFRDAETRGWYDIAICPGEYSFHQTVDLPHIADAPGRPLTHRISGYGSTLTSDQPITFLRQAYSSLADSQSQLSRHRHVVEGLTFLGDGQQIGIDIQRSQGPVFRDLQFEELASGIIGTFCLYPLVVSCKARNCERSFVLRNGYEAGWPDGTFNNSASNVAKFVSCRVQMSSATAIGFELIGADNASLQNCVTEGSDCDFAISYRTIAPSGVANSILSTLTVNDHWYEMTGSANALLRVETDRAVVTLSNSKVRDQLIVDATGSLQTSINLEKNAGFTNMPATWFRHTDGATSAGSFWHFDRNLIDSTLGAFLDPTKWDSGLAPATATEATDSY